MVGPRPRRLQADGSAKQDARTDGHDQERARSRRSLGPELAETLAKLGLRGYSDGQDDLIFVGQHGSHMDPPRFRERFYAAQDRANIRPRRLIHQLRHSFAVAMARHGAALGAIQRWLGHSSSQTTEIYAAFTPGDVEAALVTEAFAQ